MLVAQALEYGVEAHLVTPPASQFRAVTRMLGLGRRFAHLSSDTPGRHVDFARRATHAYVKGEPLDLAWWRLIGNRGVSCVVGMHTPLRYPPSSATVRLRNALYASEVFGSLVGRKSKLHLLSPLQRDQLPLSVRKNDAAIIPNGINVPDALAQRPAASPLRFLFVGRLTDQKGLDRVTSLLTGGALGTIDVLGDGPERADLNARFGSAARFHGRVAPEAVMREMAASDVLLLPSRWEAHPFTLLEAMAVGCVPLVQQLPELVDPLPSKLRWLAVDYDRPETVLQALRRLQEMSTDASLWAAMREELYRNVRERFAASTQLRLLLDFIFGTT